MPRNPGQRLVPRLVAALVGVLVVLNLASAVLVVRHFRSDATAMSRLYSGVFGGLNSDEPGAEAEALLELGEEVRRLGMPLVVTDTAGRVTAAANLPFDAPLGDPRVAEYARVLDRTNPPIRDSTVGTIHFGPLPAQRQLTVLAVFQALTIVLMVAVAVAAYRNAMAAQRDRLWVAMAREAAHQLGTPLSSLHGWIDSLRERTLDGTVVAGHLSADAERLERVARRFERIGNPARQESIGLGALAERVAGYFRPRLPRHANPIAIVVDAGGPGPTVVGDPVLLEWALEALVKNAIDALQGRPGTIQLAVDEEGPTGVLRVSDDGPGIPRELRKAIFEPGVTTKRGGWGIGLALARRVVQDAHGGELRLEPLENGTTFTLRLPLAPPEA